ncbi:uncharacterized protein ND-MLRQ [Planococcus citri]|uniref:uncharacterized protein ND-MLRQ n=1 Tax=Planococcus citri TaxID=170843 RepID=UPI0031F9634A
MGNLSKWLEANMMYGMTPKTLKKTPGLWPMYACCAAGVALATWFSLRTWLTNPDGIDPITGKGNWEKYRDKDFKLVNISGVHIPSQAPEYRMPGDPSDDSYATKSFVHPPGSSKHH